MDQLVDIVKKYNVDTNGQEKLHQEDERKFEHKVLENIAGKIVVNQVELSTLIQNLEVTLANVTKLFEKLCDIPSFAPNIKDKLQKIDGDLKASTGQ